MGEPGSDGQDAAWRKLSQRKIVQWGLGYVAVAWGLLQGLEFAVATFGWPGLITRIGAVMAAVGLPVTVTIAWFHGDRGEQRFTRTEFAILAVLLVGGSLLLRQVIEAPSAQSVATASALPTAPLSFDPHRLAVVPFGNFGDDPANAAFVSGVHDTLITQVSKVPGLSVISRSSVLQFEGKRPTIREVAVALQVGSVLEGSVARDGQRLRIQAQLIDAATDAHLWAETYDRDAGDLFAVQSEIARTVAEQLRIHLTSVDAQHLVASLTRSPQAYEHFVLGRSHAVVRDWETAIAELTQSVTLDPDFASAHAQLSMAYTWTAFENVAQRARVIPLARSEAERALELDATLPEAHLALGVFLYRGEPDIDRAALEFERAIKGLPNDAAAHQNFGFLRRWQGNWEEAAALLKRAAELDPRGFAPFSAAKTLAGLGRREEALGVIAAAQAANPDRADLAVLPASFAADMECDLATAERLLEDAALRFPGDPEVLHRQWFLAWQTGNSASAIALAQQLAALPSAEGSESNWRLAMARLAAGEDAEARRLLQENIRLADLEVDSVPSGDQRAGAIAWAGLLHTLVQEHTRAADYARRSLAELPEHGAVIQRSDILLFDAISLARAGDVAGALPLLRESLLLPAPVRARGFWCDPLFAPLRNEPQIRSLMAELGADLAIDPTRRETWPQPGG